MPVRSRIARDKLRAFLMGVFLLCVWFYGYYITLDSSAQYIYCTLAFLCIVLHRCIIVAYTNEMRGVAHEKV